MTANERLYDSGLRDEFDAAVRGGDRAALIAVLRKIAYSESDATRTADAVLANPQRYGF